MEFHLIGSQIFMTFSPIGCQTSMEFCPIDSQYFYGLQFNWYSDFDEFQFNW